MGQVPGAFAEIGVQRGNTLRKLIPLAAAQSKRIYAVDSFEGTKRVGEFDGRPDHSMSIGGPRDFFDRMDRAGFGRSEYETLIGWIPDVFSRFPPDVTFSFVIIDVDNYTPTVDSIQFVWPRLNDGASSSSTTSAPGIRSMQGARFVSSFATVPITGSSECYPITSSFYGNVRPRGSPLMRTSV